MDAYATMYGVSVDLVRTVFGCGTEIDFPGLVVSKRMLL